MPQAAHKVTKQTEINRVRRNTEYLDHRNRGETMAEYLIRKNITELDFYKNIYGNVWNKYEQLKKENDDWLTKHVKLIDKYNELYKQTQQNINIPADPPTYPTQ